MDENDPFREPNQALTILQGAIENTNEGFVTIDENHRVVIFNREAERIFGVNREEILGKDLGVILTPQCSQGHKKAVARYLDTRKPKLIGHQSEFLTARKNGELFPLSISFSVSNIGEKTFFTGIIRDLTETKALQEQVLKSERLAALGQLVAEVSHEIKNPLVMIGGYARQLLRSAQDPKGHSKLQIIVDEVRRLETLIGELRDLYRPKALSLETIDMAVLLKEVRDLIQEEARNKQIEVVLDIPPAPVMVEGDRDKLKQVILNLSRNGMEAMDQGGKLTVRAQCLEDQVEITVSDEGPGIPEPELDKIFVPFYTTKKQGTGLGLSVSKRIIEEHQGCSFSLASGRDKGAVAKITMPITACELPTAKAEAVPDKKQTKEKKMKPIQLAKDIYWVGAVDWNLRDFHGYLTEAGTTYNAYLIVDEKVTLIDTVKKEFADQLLTNIAEIIDPKKVDYVVSNHTEPDHSGGLPRIMHKIGEEKPLFCSKVGHKNLSLHYREKWNFQPVENGGSLNIGRRNLTFLETRMLHWPDSMFTYCPEDKILFLQRRLRAALRRPGAF